VWKSKETKAPIVASFPEADRPAAAALISDLIDNYQGREFERVLGVVLAMADGDLSSLADAAAPGSRRLPRCPRARGVRGLEKAEKRARTRMAGGLLREVRYRGAQGDAIASGALPEQSADAPISCC
jgi:hypothetical protein